MYEEKKGKAPFSDKGSLNSRATSSEDRHVLAFHQDDALDQGFCQFLLEGKEVLIGCPNGGGVDREVRMLVQLECLLRPPGVAGTPADQTWHQRRQRDAAKVLDHHQ